MTELPSLSPPAEAQAPPPPSRRRFPPWVTLAAFALGVGAGYLVWGIERSQPTAEQATDSPTRYSVSTDDDPSLGPADAPVTLIEFSDYNCPFCRRWYQETFPLIMDEYGDEVRFVYRDLPVVGGGEVGFVAAQAANCAGDQNAYWEYHDALFVGQFGLSHDALLAYADDLGLDRQALEECLDSGYYEEEVRGDLADAFALGVGSTPTFFINGIAVIGAQSSETFLAIIQSELAQ